MDETEGNVPPPGGGEDIPEMASITEILTEEELGTLPEAVRGKLDSWTTEIARNVKSVVTEKDSQISKLSGEVEEVGSSNETLKSEMAQARKNLDETGDRYRASVTNLAQVEETIISYQKQIAEAQIKADMAVREKDEMVMVVNKRNDEVERMSESMRTLSDQLQAATVAKIEALVKIDELTGKDMELEYKEKQLEREKEWVSKQVQMLNDELEKKSSEIITMQREFSIKHLQLQTELSEKNEQIKISELTLSNCQKANEAQEKHIEHLINKLKESEDIETKMQENYRQELSSQRKIADLYKESSEEASRKVEELEDAVSSLQDLLKNATVKYGELETNFAKAGKSFQDEIAAKHDKIATIEKELQNANKLIESFQSKGLTNEMIQSLSPAAAAATSMLKNSKSLTQIYSEYHDLCSEVIIKKQEVNKLNQMVKELLQEIETQGPELEKEKLKNKKNLEKLEVLQNQLDLALRDSERSKSETAHVSKTLAGMERENSRLRSQVNDLAMQVRSLIKETEVQRGNYSAVASRTSVTSGIAEVPDIEASGQQVVSDRLVTFRNIEELQMQNQRLLAVVRELTESQEKTTNEIHENKLQLIKDNFQEAMRELEVLREKRKTQDTLLQSIIQQRDALAELLKQPKSPVKVPDPTAAGKLAEIQKQHETLQVTHKSLQEEFDTYKKERAEHEKIAVEQTEKLRDDVMKMRTDNAKLGSQVEYNNERAKIYNANLATYKKNITVLEERNKKYSATTLKLEQNLELLKSELSGAQQKLARTEVALNSMTQERNSLRDTNARLQAERDLLKRDQSTQQMLRLNLQEIKNNLDMSNSSLKSKMESEIENLRKENAILHRKVSTETERFKEAVFSWESANKELIQKLRNDQDSLQDTKEKLEDAKATISRLTGEVEDLQSQVKVLSNPTIEPVNASEDQPVTIPALERQIKDLKAQLRDAKIEIETLNQHLAVSRQSAEEYRSLCSSIEGQISIVSDTSKQLTEELQQRLEGKDEIIRDIQARLSVAEREAASLKDEKVTILRDSEAKTVALDEEICRMRRDLQAANSKLQTAFEENVKIKSELEKQTLVYQDIQEKYEKELAAHSSDTNTLNEVKIELESVRLRIIDEEQSRRNAENQLSQSLNDWTAKAQQLQNELSRLKESKEDLESLNTSLQDQIINLTTRLEVASKPTGESSDDASGTSDAESQQKSSEQWLQLIRYLRREKEIAKTKTEMAEATSSRYESQIQHLEKQIEQLKRELSELQDRSHVSIITSAKQADLLRKVETLSALTDSNRMLREEKDTAVAELSELKQKVSVLDVEIGPLREKASELEGRCEALLNENTALKQDVGRWRTRAASLLEKSNKVNPEEMKRLQTEADNMTRQMQSMQEINKKQQLEITKNMQQLKALQQQTMTLQAGNQTLQNEKKLLADENKKIADEREKLRAEFQTARLEVSSLKNAQVERDNNLEQVSKEIDNVNKLLEEQKNTVKAVKSIARKYKKQYEDLQKEQEERGIAKPGQPDGSADNVIGDTSITEAQREEIAKCEAQVKQLQDEIEVLKRDAELAKADRSQAEERMRNLVKNLREKLNSTNAQKTEAEGQMNELKTKCNTLENSVEEREVRFAALKSQYEGRLIRLEKENKDLKATTVGPTPTEYSTVRQEKEELEKENEMIKQRMAALENRFKLQNQTSKVVTPEKVLPVEKAKANIRPIAGPSPKQATVARPPLTASIRPISMPRKATVSVSAMPTQNSQASSSNIQSVSPVVAPVSQAQVSTSTPDQSSSAPESSPQQQIHQLTVNASTSNVPISSAGRQAAAVQPTVTVAPVAAGLGVVGSNTSSSNSVSTPASGVSGIGGPQQQQGSSGSSSGAANDTQASHQDPSTSSATQMMEESEMGDSSEQVSSSEGSTHQNILSVAPLRSKQHDAQQSSSSSSGIQHQPQPGPSTKKQGGSTSAEEPSPSSSTLRPTQSSNKRGREDPHHSHHDDEEDLLNEPDTKRTRVMGSTIDREAEALGQQESSNDQMIEEEEEEEDEHEADQGPSAADDAQVQHSDTTTKESNVRQGRRANDGHDSDSDVIIIDSDDDDEVGHATNASTSRANKQLPVEDEEVDDVEEEEVDEEEQDDEEDLIDDDEDVDEDDEDHGDDDGQEGKKMDEDYDDVEGQEGREAESLEHDDDEIQEADNSHDESQDILDSNDSNLNPMDFSSQDQSNQQHELREAEAEQSIDDEGIEDGELVPEPIVVAPIASGSSSLGATGSPIRPPREFNTRPQSISTPMRATPAMRGSLPPQLGRQQPQLTPSFSSGQFADDADDSIVPSTPTLFVPRRSDGFAEAVSSPQIQPGGRFTFSSVGVSVTESSSSGVHAGTSASSSANNVLDDTRLDFLGYDEGGSGNTGRSVPSTPLQVSPPVEGLELAAELQADEDAAQEEGLSAAIIVDVHPTSSSIASISGSDIPAITVTSAMESSSRVSFQPPQEGTSKGTLDPARLAATGSQQRSSTQSEVSNVTSSDEDKVLVAGTSSSSVGSMQRPSTSSRAASPTPSSNTSNPPTEQKEPLPQPQHHHQQQQQGGRTRPTPIVWDQPSSSSSANPTSRPIRGGMMGGRGMPVRHMIQPDQGHIMPQILRGGYRPMMPLRGQNQSARRSRPHSRGGPSGVGPGNPGPGPGSLGGRMPFQKPY
ncbi:unnamed protein product [Orchesella dallaii]|uniref:Nucleoprotein TPR n=1 Tax=Orchesella dallaii TaxID=48710 RepID=A0ABP1QI35_9HEXA